MRTLDSFEPSGPLDPIETVGRDVFGLDVLKWQEFRHAIYVGNDASKIIPQGSTCVSEDLKIEYQTLAKSHYQSVSHLVSAYHCLEIVCEGPPHRPREYAAYFRAQPEFYFHLGATLDGIARVAFILCTRGQSDRLKKMNWWDYGQMRKWDSSKNRYVFCPGFEEMGKLVDQYNIEEIYLVRNGVTHGWQIPARVDQQGRIFWPEEIKTQRFLAWPYSEFDKFSKYTWKHTIENTIRRHFANANCFFNDAFAYLILRIPDWEKDNNVEIARV